MRLTIEVSEGPADIRVGQAGTAQPYPLAGEVGAPASVPADAVDAGADRAPQPPELRASLAPPQTGGSESDVPAGEVRSAGPAPSAYAPEPQAFPAAIEVDIAPGAGPVVS
ncbi:hypothetical protein ACIBU0_33585 [Streptomyces sp. NPDC049627]|uniref:hypothetical protein n=1 Tax=Streptomyces sp. NPDC049627 TaxID=3365595 RepID=UPI0037A3E817